MSVIIRLQNLPWSANALDIRGFFRGLSIPDGGVHIVGGEMGDAFIAFSTDEDARQAMMLDRGKINEVQIRLLLSSRTEMQKVIEKARQVSLSMMQLATQQKSQSPLLTTNSAIQPSAAQSLTKPLISQLSQPPPSQITDTPLVVTPQPPVITSNSLTNILSNNCNQRPNKLGSDNKPYQLYGQVYGMNDNPVDPRIINRDKSIYDNMRDTKPFDNDDKIRGRSRELDRDRHRSSRSSSRSRDRRRSRSRDRGGRRRRNRSRSHSRDRRNRYRRSRSRERSRDRNRAGNRGRDSDRERGRDRRDSRDDKHDSKQRDLDKNKKNDKSEKIDDGDSPMVIADDDDNDAPGFIQEKKNTNVWDTSNPVLNASLKPIDNNYAQAYTTQAQANMPSYQTNIANINTPANMQMNLIQNQFQQLQQQLQHPPPNLRNNDQANNLQTPKPTTQSMNSLNFQGYFNSNLVSGFNNYSLNSGDNLNPEDNKRQVAAFQNPYTMSSTFSGNKTDNLKKEEETHSNTTNFAGIFSTNTAKDDGDKCKLSYSSYAAFQTQNKKTDDVSERGSGTPNSGSSDPYKTPDTKNSDEVNYDDLKGRCIKISNMCQSTSYSDLRRFFSGLYISNNGIKMINDKHGLRIGVAYIRFVRPESKPKAFTRNGLSLKNKKVLIESVSEDEFDAAQDSFKPLRRRGYDEDDRDQRREDGRESLAPQDPFSALMLTDLPHFAKEQDIMKMFSNYSLLDILLRDDFIEDDSKAQYVAYVKFHQADDAKAAYQDIARHYIGYKKVTVKALSDQEFINAKEKHSAELEALVRPTDRDELEEDLREPETREKEEREEGKLRIDEEEAREAMEKDFEANEGNVQCLQEESNGTSQPYEPDDETIVNEDSKSADTARTLSSENRDPRIDQDRVPNTEIPSLLNLPPAMPNDPRRRDGRTRSRFNNDDNKNQNQKLSNFILIRNCDYKSTKLDFAKFFFSAGLNPSRIEILYNNRNQPSGECIVEFSCPADADSALFKTNSMCGNRRIRLEIVSPSFVANCLGEDFLKSSGRNNSLMSPYGNNDMRNFNLNISDQQNNMNNPFGNLPKQDYSMNRQDDSNSAGRFNNNNPFRVGGNSNMSNNMNNNLNNSDPRGGADNNNARANRRLPRPSRFSDFNDTSNNSMSSNNNNNMIRFGNDNPINQQQMLPQKQQQPNDIPQTLSNATVDQFGQPGCVVGMENVPYKAGIEDILEFFGKFEVQPHNVIRRYNDDGTPTGDARVAFRSPLEARTAIENKRHHKILNRTIFLSLV